MHITSYIESLWRCLKRKIKNTYLMIPAKFFVSFLREAEWKVSNSHKSYE